MVNTKVYLIFYILVVFIFSSFIMITSGINSVNSYQSVITYDNISKYINFEKTPDEIAKASEGIIIHDIEQSKVTNR